MLQSCLLRKDFDFRRNSRPTVPLYADRRELLSFRNFFNSLPACRKRFFDTLNRSPETLFPESGSLFKSCEFPTKHLNFFRSSSRICHSEERRIIPPVSPCVILRNEVTKNLYSPMSGRSNIFHINLSPLPRIFHFFIRFWNVFISKSYKNTDQND